MSTEELSLARSTEIKPEEILSSIIDVEKKIPPEYQSLIIGQEKRNPRVRGSSAESSSTWIDLADWEQNPQLPFFRDHLIGQTLIDLGGAASWMKRVAQNLKCRSYINVDRAPYDKDFPDLNPLTPTEHSSDGNLINIRVHDDMLDFVSRMKDGVGNFTMNGIDKVIIDDNEYHEALAQEIVRTTKRGGLIFGVSSEALSCIYNLIKNKRIPFRIIEPKDGSRIIMGSGCYVFEKIE